MTGGAYNEKGNLSRADFATRICGIAEDLNVADNEESIISIIVPHFTADIRRLVRLQKIKTKDDLIEILQ